MSYTVTFTRHAAKALKALEKTTQKRILDALKTLAKEPRAPQHDVKKLKGGAGEYRLRVGDYRVIYTLTDSKLEVTVVDVAHRRDAYS
ncbi:type II toxin-antitoxin system RelE/ParE family toxin [Streptomyces sp. NA04227]|uniref:type II toxin-antitoxin system RelE family toxin n=1 Tax=Streptomyces sp. NA04227 TaxID=2742136 RepID=UPI001591A2DC|nr:type II toxin-antitoxin system RelE/ParE family toxin [Streptomyces sp. NA04227]QKW09224.1 type II toxin-antitoxin system RelE/ParE family toxin [Streptomyces sp. NA04227]